MQQALEQILPALEQIQESVSTIEERVNLFVPRVPLTTSVKQKHQQVISSMGGRCPCCGVREIVDKQGLVVEAEFDHFYSRERNGFTDTWLICRPCHLSMKNRADYSAEFQVYQRRALMFDNGQLTLELD